MAKKQVKKPKRVWPKGKPKATKKSAPKKKAKTPKAPKPRLKQRRLFDDMPALPKLDKVLEQIATVREDINDYKTTEKGLIQHALREMQTHNRQVYKAHGVEVTRVTGDEKLRVRLVNDDNGGQAEDDDGGDDPDTNQDDADGDGEDINVDNPDDGNQDSEG